MRGAPDYGQQDFPVALPDLSNDMVVSAILGFSPLDLRGRLVVLDQFKTGIYQWGRGSSGGGSNPIIDVNSRHSYASEMSVKFFPSANGANSYIERKVRLAEVEKLGVEGAFHITGTAGFPYLSVQVDISTVGYINFGVMYNVQTGKFHVHSSASWLDSGLITLPAGIAGDWIPFKVVCDCANLRYDRIVFGHQNFIFSSNVSPSVGASIDPYRTIITMGVLGSTGFTADVYGGYIILTRDEP